MAEHPNLTAALAAAQGEFPAIEKKSTNPHFGSKYADLADGMTEVRPILSKHGIAYTQTFHVADGILLLRTSLWYGSEELPSELPIIQPARPQEFVALTTYYRRVGLFSICGITPADEDDDGNTANDVATTQAPAPKPPRQTEPDLILRRPARTNGHSPAPTMDDRMKSLVHITDENGEVVCTTSHWPEALRRYGEVKAAAKIQHAVREVNVEALRQILLYVPEKSDTRHKLAGEIREIEAGLLPGAE